MKILIQTRRALILVHHYWESRPSRDLPASALSFHPFRVLVFGVETAGDTMPSNLREGDVVASVSSYQASYAKVVRRGWEWHVLDLANIDAS